MNFVSHPYKVIKGKVTIQRWMAINLKCEVDDVYPPPEITIFHDNENLHLKQTNNSFVSVIISDSGLYCCRASNPFWSFSKCFSVATRVRTEHAIPSVVIPSVVSVSKSSPSTVNTSPSKVKSEYVVLISAMAVLFVCVTLILKLFKNMFNKLSTIRVESTRLIRSAKALEEADQLLLPIGDK